jgi:hypothetical protein
MAVPSDSTSIPNFTINSTIKLISNEINNVLFDNELIFTYKGDADIYILTINNYDSGYYT